MLGTARLYSAPGERCSLKEILLYFSKSSIPYIKVKSRGRDYFT